MCGIIGVYCTSYGICANLIFNGLKYMQNRGYDSAGVCSIIDGSHVIRKYASTTDCSALERLETVLKDPTGIYSGSLIGFGHTRWATHGSKTDNNSHPHNSFDGKFTIAHNGILENFESIKGYLLSNNKNMVFKSDTDTEIICNLIAYVYQTETNHSTDNDVRKAIEIAQSHMCGSWGLVIQCTDLPDHMYCVRHGSPLLVGKTDTEAIIVSEQSGFGNRINNYFTLNSNDICVITNNNNKIHIDTHHTYTTTLTNTQLFIETPHPYQHWTIREIYEQEHSANNAINMGGRVRSPTEVHLGGLHTYKDIISNMDNLILLGCGTSYHSGFIAMNYFKDLCDLNCVLLFDGAEFSKRDIPRNGKTMAIFISQSGETKDLHRCIEIAKDNDVFTIGAINVVDSYISREVICGVYLNAGPEIAVASTKAFSSQVIVLSLIAIWIAQSKELYLSKRIQYISDLYNLCIDITSALSINTRQIHETILPMFMGQSSCFLLGKGMDEGTAREGALKIKEITYVHAEGYSSSALKHGPFALLNQGFPVILLSPHDQFISKNNNAYQELIARDAAVIVISNKDITNPRKYRDNEIIVPRNVTFQPLINIIPIQLISYYLAVKIGINPDTPKNLAKVVTVE